MVSIINSKTLKYYTFLEKTLVLSIICSNSCSKDKQILKKESVEISNNNKKNLINQKSYKKINMAEENISQEFRL